MFRIALGILSVCERYGVCWFNLLRIGHVIFLGLDFDTVTCIYFPLAMLFSFGNVIFLWHFFIFVGNVTCYLRWQCYFPMTILLCTATPGCCNWILRASCKRCTNCPQPWRTPRCFVPLTWFHRWKACGVLSAVLGHGQGGAVCWTKDHNLYL